MMPAPTCDSFDGYKLRIRMWFWWWQLFFNCCIDLEIGISTGSVSGRCHRNGRWFHGISDRINVVIYKYRLFVPEWQQLRLYHSQWEASYYCHYSKKRNCSKNNQIQLVFPTLSFLVLPLSLPSTIIKPFLRLEWEVVSPSKDDMLSWLVVLIKDRLEDKNVIVLNLRLTLQERMFWRMLFCRNVDVVITWVAVGK